MNQKLGRNDPCPCGSGKKYKHCCLKAEAARVGNDRSEAIPKAIQWLLGKHGKAAWEAIDNDFFGSLNDEEYALIQELPDEIYDGILLNAMEWLLADGLILIKDEEHRVVDLLFGKGGPLLSAEQRQWLEALTARPIRLYEIIGVTPGHSMTLRDVILPDSPAVLVHEQTGSKLANPYDLIGARVVPVEGRYELSGAVYPFNRQVCWDLLEELRDELQGVEPDSALAKEITAVIIPDYWLSFFVTPFELPQIVDQTTGEPLLFVTDHYRVKDWEAFELALSREGDLEGNREAGWSLLFAGEDGLMRRRLGIEVGKRPDRIKVTYHTQRYADEGRPWFEAVADTSIVFVSREIADPKGMLSHPQPLGEQGTPTTEHLPPEVLTELIEKRIHQLYTDWADAPMPALGDRTPREAIQTPEGLEQVKFVLHTYEHGEAQQARDQNRNPVSYNFLWQSLGIKP